MPDLKVFVVRYQDMNLDILFSVDQLDQEWVYNWREMLSCHPSIEKFVFLNQLV